MKIPKTKEKQILALIVMLFSFLILAFNTNENTKIIKNKYFKDIDPIPFSIVFVGIDNEIDSTGTDKITLMLVRELKHGESFSITNAVFHKKDSLNSVSYWTSPSGSANISSQQITYTGGSDLPPGTIICGEVPGDGTGSQLLINNLSINGNLADNLFEVVNDGVYSNEGLDMKTNRWGNYYIYQGLFFEENGKLNLLGTIIDGISMGITQSSLEEIGIPAELSQVASMSVINNTGSNYVYVLCDGVLYKCGIEFTVKDWNNWNRYEGTDGDDMSIEDICDMLCGVSDCNGILEISVDTTGGNGEELCDYGICLMEFGVPTGFIEDIHVVLPDGTEHDLNGEPEFTFNYYGDQPTYICDLADDVQEWLDNNGYPGTAFMSNYYQPWSGGCRGMPTCNFLVIEGTNVEFIHVFGQEDDVNDPIQYEYFIQSNCGIPDVEGGTTLIAEMDNCEEPDYLWSTGETTQSIVVEDPEWYTVTVTCGDTCVYVDSILISPMQNGLIPRSIETKELVDMKVYPNPAQSTLIISLGVFERGKYTIEISDAIGKIVKTINVVFAKGHNKIDVDIKDLIAGIYSVRVKDKSEYKPSRFTKID